MRGFGISIGAVALCITLGIWLGDRWWSCWIYPNTGLTTIFFFLVCIVLPGGVCLEIVDFVRRRSTKEKESSPEPLGERIVTERVLVVCPYCGAKNEQGILKCRACGAEM